MNKSFRTSHGSKNRSSSASFLSLHFNKADEDQLQINYVEKEETGKNDLNKLEKSEEPAQKCSDGESSDNDDSVFKNIDENDSLASKSAQSSRDSTPSRESVVREYWARISKRTSSLDSDLGCTDTEPWPLLKGIKGKFAKTLEEHKSQLRKSTDKSIQDTEVGFSKKSALEVGPFDPDLTPTESRSNNSLQLSPAIEASEVETEEDLFENYINDELDKVKCEIISTKPASGSQFYLQQPSKPIKKTDTSPTSHPTIVLTPEDNPDANRLPEQSQTSKNSTIQNRATEETTFSSLIYRLKRYYYFGKSYWNTVIIRILIAVVALLFVPIPSWISGFLSGAFLSGYIVYCLFQPPVQKKAFVLPDFSQLPPSNIPVAEVEDENIIHKGWMNELPSDLNYDPKTYNVTCTRSIYIRLDGSYLRVSYPQSNIPKRAMFNERRHDMQFIHQQLLDITGSSVELLPVGLARIRLWSKKYPICLKIPNPKQSNLTSTTKITPDSSPLMKTSSKKESQAKKFLPRINDNNEIVLYLFSRTDREKDVWYNRFKKASRLKLLRSHSPSSSPNIAAMDTLTLETKRAISVDQLCSTYSVDSPDIDEDDLDSFTDLSMTKQQKFEMYMTQLMAPLHIYSPSGKDKKDEGRKYCNTPPKYCNTPPSNLTWCNVLIGRLFFDFLTEDVWGSLVAEKIRRKLGKIKLPVFLRELSVRDINLGTALPKIHRASEPCLDHRGLWVDVDVSYNGSFQMTLETKINLLRNKLDSDDLSLSDISKESDTVDHILRSPIYNSEEEDSAESSSDEDIPMPEVTDIVNTDTSSTQAPSGSTGKKILRLVDRFAQSTYFQQAAKNKYIKKAMADISNTPLLLTVEVQWLTGTLALNIPPMPTDRLWYGFRTNPQLSIVARPKLGQHVVKLTHVTDWIEKKLVSEFQKILVMPNMDDLIIPIMLSEHGTSKSMTDFLSYF